MFPSSIQDIPVEWLTSVLREAGALPQGEVIGTAQEDNPAFNSQVAHLTLMLFHPVWDQTYQGSNRTYWWPKMQCLTGAYRDWGCEELLD